MPPGKKPVHPFGLVGARIAKAGGFPPSVRRALKALQSRKIRDLTEEQRKMLFGNMDARTIGQVKQLAALYSEIQRHRGIEKDEGLAKYIEYDKEMFGKELRELLKKISQTQSVSNKLAQEIEAKEDELKRLLKSGKTENDMSVAILKAEISEIKKERFAALKGELEKRKAELKGIFERGKGIKSKEYDAVNFQIEAILREMMALQKNRGVV